MTRNQLPKASNHPLWHHLVMIAYCEVVNLVWLLIGIVIAIGGSAVFKFTTSESARIAVGLPIIGIGVSISLLKLHEISLVITRFKRLKAMCIFCNEQKTNLET